MFEIHATLPLLFTRTKYLSVKYVKINENICVCVHLADNRITAIVPQRRRFDHERQKIRLTLTLHVLCKCMSWEENWH